MNNNTKVINIKDISNKFNSNNVKNKTSAVIKRVNLMIKDSNVKINSKTSIFDVFSNNKFIMVVLVLCFICSCITVRKTFSLKNKVDEVNEFYANVEITNKESSEMVVKVDSVGEIEESTGMAADDLVNCIKSPLDVDNLPDSINSIIVEINNYYDQSNDYFAFKYKDIYTGFSVSYNENQKIFTASTIKGPTDIYLYEMASLGKIDLDEELTYTSKYYNDGAGKLKNKEFDTKHDVRTLLKYSTVDSDNAAHNMLMDRFGRENMLNFWKEKGTSAIFTQWSNWGVTSASDAAIYMSELYRFSLENKEYGSELMKNFINSYPKFIKGRNNYKVANKSGWSGSAIHDVSIVFAKNPYIIVALSNLGNTDTFMDYFSTVNYLTYKLHNEYWKYKMETCSNINQY